MHTGHLPFLLASPTFLLGLALQLPVAALCVLLVHRVIGTLPGGACRRRLVPEGAWLPLTDSRLFLVRSVLRPRPTGRGPPPLLAS